MVDATEETRVIALSQDHGDFVTGDDGFVVFWPDGRRGAFGAWHLRLIADELDRRNAAWAARIEAAFAHG